MPTTQGLPDTSQAKAVQLTGALAVAAGAHTVATASGGAVMLTQVVVYCSVVGATFTSVSIETDDTVPVEIMSAVEGAVANVVAGKNLKVFTTPTVIPSGKHITLTIIGATGTGTLLVDCVYRSMVNGALLS